MWDLGIQLFLESKAILLCQPLFFAVVNVCSLYTYQDRWFPWKKFLGRLSYNVNSLTLVCNSSKMAFCVF